MQTLELRQGFANETSNADCIERSFFPNARLQTASDDLFSRSHDGRLHRPTWEPQPAHADCTARSGFHDRLVQSAITGHQTAAAHCSLHALKFGRQPTGAVCNRPSFLSSSDCPMALTLESSRHIPCAVSLRFADGTWNVPATLRVKSVPLD